MRLYRRIARWVLPSEYRDTVGQEMAAVAGEVLTAVGEKGRVAWALTWLRLHADLVATGVALRRRVWTRLWGDLGFDLRVTLRRLRRSPGYSATVLAILILGIGGNTAAFRLLDLVLFRPLPYPSSEELVAVSQVPPGGDGGSNKIAPRVAEGVRSLSSTISSVAVLDQGTLALSSGGPAEVVTAATVSPGLLEVLGVQPSVGRTFRPEEGVPGAHRVVVLSHGLRARLFAPDEEVLGRTVNLEAAPYTVVGVLPPDFQDPTGSLEGGADVWVPLALERGDPLVAAAWVEAIGRLRRGRSPADARRELDALRPRLTALDPTAYPTGTRLQVTPLRDRFWGDAGAALSLLLGATGLVLLIACANLAGLVSARTADREHEVALGAALGAGRMRIVRQVFGETLVLALFGAAGGLALSSVLVEVARSLTDARMPGLASVGPDVRVVAFTVATALGTAFLAGLAPAWRAARTRPQDLLRESSRRIGGRRKSTSRDVLVVGQLALSVALLLGATLATRSLGRILAVETGYQPDDVLTFEVRLPRARYATEDEVVAFQAELLERLGSLPGVESVGAVDKRPLGTRWGCGGITSSDRPTPERPEDWPCSESRSASAGYFEAMGIDVLEGRAFDAGDGRDDAPVVLVNETFAGLFWPDGDALGREVRWASGAGAPSPWRTVVGVVEDVKHRGLAADADPEVYMPYPQAPDPRMTFVLRAASGAPALVEPARTRVAELDRDLPIRSVATMGEAMAADAVAYRLAAVVLAGLAVLALALALTGIHGALSYLVSRRTREIGIRISLGADPADVLGMVVGRGARLAAVALALGLPLAMVGAHLMRGMLVGVGPLDPVAWVPVVVVVIGAAVASSYLPARRALGVDPAATLREE